MHLPEAIGGPRASDPEQRARHVKPAFALAEQASIP
jgi:hypothetical protein